MATALVVGTCLVAINQLGPLLDGPRTSGVFLRIALDFVVPFVTSSLGLLSARHPRGPSGAAPRDDGLAS